MEVPGGRLQEPAEGLQGGSGGPNAEAVHVTLRIALLVFTQ